MADETREITCPSCGAGCVVSTQMLGREIKCPECTASFLAGVEPGAPDAAKPPSPPPAPTAEPEALEEPEEHLGTVDEIEELLAEEATPTAPKIIAAAWILSAIIHCTLLIVFARIIMTPGYDGDEGGYIGVPVEPPSNQPRTAAELNTEAPVDTQMALELESIPTADVKILPPSMGSSKTIQLSARPARLQVFQEVRKKRGHLRKLLFPKKILPSKGSTFFQIKAHGRKFIYIVDRSASMNRQTTIRLDREGSRVDEGTLFQIAKRELMRSIRSLEPGARFHVYFFADAKEMVELSTRALVWATEEKRRLCFEWIKRVGTGTGTDPLPAVRSAIALKPDAIYLLCDGRFEESIAKEIGFLGQSKGVKINTVALVDNSGEKMLEQIAKQSQATYRFVEKDTSARTKGMSDRIKGKLD